MRTSLKLALSLVLAASSLPGCLGGMAPDEDVIEEPPGVQPEEQEDELCEAGRAGDGCERCQIGSFCAGGTSPEIGCSDGAWDHDADPATACEPWSACAPGTRVVQPGSPIGDRVCAECAAGTFTDEANQDVCAPASECAPGQFEAAPPTLSADRVCEGCAVGTFSSAPGAQACAPWSECGDDAFVEAAGSQSSDRECAPCPEGATSFGPNAPACMDSCTVALGFFCADFTSTPVKAHVPGTADLFGVSIAIDGDTLVVGATGESSDSDTVNGDATNDNAFVSGAAYVFVRDASTGAWTQQAYLKAPDARAGDQFGLSVAIDGDTIVVGAPNEERVRGENTQNFDAGAAYVFRRVGTQWSSEQVLRAPFPGRIAQCGQSVAISGDVVAMGCPQESGNTNTGGPPVDGLEIAGAVHVFERSGATWTHQAYVRPPLVRGKDDLFGWSVALSGDTLAVGAVREDSSSMGLNGDVFDDASTDSGAVYVFERSSANWIQRAFLKPDRVSEEAWFGSAVSLTGDTLIVGARFESNAGSGIDPPASFEDALLQGAVYVFRNQGGWTQEAYIKASNSTSGAQFGSSVAFDEGVLIVGASDQNSSATGVNPAMSNDLGASDSGAFYVFMRDGTAWSEKLFVKPSVTDAFDSLGYAVAVSGSTIVASSPEEDSSFSGVGGDLDDNTLSNSGLVQIYELPP